MFLNYIAKKKYSYAELVCEKILESPQNDYSLASFLAMVQYDHLDKRDCAYRAASDIIENNKKLDNRSKNIVYRIVIDYNLQNKNNALMQKYIDKLINDDNVFFDAKLYGVIKDFINLNQKKEFFNKMAKFEESLDQCYGIRAIESMDKKDYSKAEEYFAKAEEVRLKYPREQTYNLYKLIVDKLVDNNIKVLSMQYPVRSIKPLKQMLKNEEYYDRIIFINNENNFKDLLKTKQFKEVFEDQFAGDFGHYKQDGSVLIAENVIARLEKIIINNGQNI